MALTTGRAIDFDDEIGIVVATTATTDANGRGSLSYGGQTFYFRVLKASADGATEFPWVATSDTYWRMGLLKHPSQNLYCLVSDHPPAPGWGRWIEQTEWKAASWFAGDTATLHLGWRPGVVTVDSGGNPAQNVWADMEFTHTTSLDGSCKCWWEPVYPDDAGNGHFYTDASGRLWDYATGSAEYIIVPRGFGAIGHRSTDTWPSMPTPERTLSELRVSYMQETAIVSEGANTTLDVSACNLTVTGPPNAKVVGWWGAAVVRFETTLDGAGSYTANGLVPGEYHVALYHPTTAGYGLPRQTVTVSESGTSYTLDFGSSWDDYTGNNESELDGIVYKAGAVPSVGAQVWAGGEAGAQHIATTGADGTFSVTAPFPIVWVAVMSDDGCHRVMSHPKWYDPCVGGCFGGLSDTSPELEGLLPWGADGAHRNLHATGVRFGYVKSEETGEEYDINRGSYGGYVSDPVPGYLLDTADEEPDDWIGYTIYSADDEVLLLNQKLEDDTNPPWLEAGSSWWEDSAEGDRLWAITGGKIHGAAWQADSGTEVTSALPEVFRLGGEFGDDDGPLEVRHDSVTADDDAALTFTAFVCAYCGGAIWNEPSIPASVRTWCCIPCFLNYGLYVDARAGFRSKTIVPATDWTTRIVKISNAGTSVDWSITGWPRPYLYEETGDYLATLGGLSRWVAQHQVLGTITAGVFADGATPDYPVMLKLLLTDDYAGSGCTVTVTATHVTSGSQQLTATVASGSASGDIIALDWHPHHAYPDGYYTDVTNATCSDALLSCQIVNDGPCWRSSSGTEVTDQASTPWACDFRLSAEDICCFHQLPNFLYVFYGDSGMKHVYTSPPGQWFETHITRAHYNQPKTDTTEDDSSPSGYVDSNGRSRLYVIRSGALVRLTSPNWGLTWGTAVATAITSASQAFAFPSNDRSRQFCVYITGTTFTFAYSHDHLTTVDGSSTISTGVDDGQVCGYHGADGYIYAYGFVAGALTCWRMSANGVWNEVGTV